MDEHQTPGQDPILPFPEGWLPDPQDPGIDRWWDGRAWTGATRPRFAVQGAAGAPAPGGKFLGKTLGLVALGIVVVLAAVIGVVMAARGGGSGGEVEAIAIPTAEPVVSSSDDWFTAVCKSGTFEDRPPYRNLPSSSDFARCRSNLPPKPMVFIGTYSSEYKMKEDLLSMGNYATLTANSGSIVVFALPPKSTVSHLEPLEKYGFTITKRK